MEVPGGKNFKFPILFMEALGTATLLYTINLSGGAPLAVGLTISANIFIFGSCTGGHFNPAVSFGVFVREYMEGNADASMVLYLIQIVIA